MITGYKYYFQNSTACRENNYYALQGDELSDILDIYWLKKESEGKNYVQI